MENNINIQDNKIMINERLKNLGINIKSARLHKRFSQEQLAEKCNISRNALSLIETGKVNATILRILDISNQLGISISDLTKNI